jgi:hypothetical protein
MTLSPFLSLSGNQRDPGASHQSCWRGKINDPTLFQSQSRHVQSNFVIRVH